MNTISKILIGCGLLAFAVWGSIKIFPSGRNDRLQLCIIPLANGWGYDILKDGKIFIHQTSIPCIKGNKPFADKTAALKTGTLVIDKLKEGRIPSVNREELNELGIVK